MSTAHNKGNLGDFGKVVLMPGDPLRAKYIAENFLEDVKLISDVRNMFAYTGFYKGVRVSVMGSGMGMPSIGIYSNELFQFMGVETIIRIGSSGSYQKEVELNDLIIAESAMSDSNFGQEYGKYSGEVNYAYSSKELVALAKKVANDENIKYHIGSIYSSDIFYNPDPNTWIKWKNRGALAVEMESYALFTIAEHLHKKALCLLTVSDSFITHQGLSSEARQNSFKNMVILALNIAVKLEGE